MKQILTIIGARPQIIKAAAISRAIRESYSDQISEYILHTGQHYDENMSQVFFEEMNIPHPDHNLSVGSGSHGGQTASMIRGVEDVLLEIEPDAVLVYGDTNSTLAAAVAASKLRVPVVHVEAGLRSFNKSMPEEINRITCDHCSTLLFSPTSQGMFNLKQEGFDLEYQGPFTIDRPGVFHCGDVMYDNSLYFKDRSAEVSTMLEDNALSEGQFYLATIHRDNNTDDPSRLTDIFNALLEISQADQNPIVLPLHPRTKKMMSENLSDDVRARIDQSSIRIIDPVSFLDMTRLESACKMVITDSGGVQKEAFFFEKPCVILRSETEWVEIVENGNAIIADASYDRIMEAWQNLTDKNDFTHPPLFGDGKAAQFIVSTMIDFLS